MVVLLYAISFFLRLGFPDIPGSVVLLPGESAEHPWAMIYVFDFVSNVVPPAALLIIFHRRKNSSHSAVVRIRRKSCRSIVETIPVDDIVHGNLRDLIREIDFASRLDYRLEKENHHPQSISRNPFDHDPSTAEEGDVEPTLGADSEDEECREWTESVLQFSRRISESNLISRARSMNSSLDSQRRSEHASVEEGRRFRSEIVSSDLDAQLLILDWEFALDLPDLERLDEKVETKKMSALTKSFTTLSRPRSTSSNPFPSSITPLDNP